MLARDLWHDWKAHVASHPKRNRPRSVAENPDRPDPQKEWCFDRIRVIPDDAYRHFEFDSSRRTRVAAVAARCSVDAGVVIPADEDLSDRSHDRVEAAGRTSAVRVPYVHPCSRSSEQGLGQVFASFWQAWVDKSGPIGAVVGMAIGAGLMCNV